MSYTPSGAAINQDTIRKFVFKTFLKSNKSIVLSDDDSFFEEGIIDSLGVLELVTFLEQTYGFRVQDSELVPENLDSINNIINFVNMKLAGVKRSQ